MNATLTQRAKTDAQILAMLRISRGDIRRVKQAGWYTGCWSDHDVDRVVEDARVRAGHEPRPIAAPVGMPAHVAPAVRDDIARVVPAVRDDIERVIVTATPEPDDNLIPRARMTAMQDLVLRALCRGMSNREIGNQLYISEDTVKSHIKAVLRALGVNDRTAAVVAVLTCAVIPYTDQPVERMEDLDDAELHVAPKLNEKQAAEKRELLAALAGK